MQDAAQHALLPRAEKTLGHLPPFLFPADFQQGMEVVISNRRYHKCLYGSGPNDCDGSRGWI
jgi:hypothetical protein